MILDFLSISYVVAFITDIFNMPMCIFKYNNRGSYKIIKYSANK